MIKDPTICKYWTKNGFTKVWGRPEEHSIKIGGITYIPYQFAYNKDLKEYVWKFKKSGAEARASVS